MAVNFVFISDIVPVAQRIFPFWDDKPVTLLMSDIHFIEGGVLLVFGALVAGVVLYNSWAALDVRQVQFTEYIWNWKRMKEERDSPVGLIFGLTILAVGIIYVLVAVLVSAGIIPSL
jgi:amino acid transporter